MEKILIKIQMPKKVVEYLMKSKKLENLNQVKEYLLDLIKNALPEKAKSLFEEKKEKEEEKGD